MLRIATIGTSMITDNLVEVLNENPGAAFVGTLSRDTGRAAAFTSERGGTRPFASLDELCACDEVDAVYIASPNALHREQALACIAAGKHVLVEKPFCSTETEAVEVFEAARAAGVVALEAMRPVHDPALYRWAELVPCVGRLRRTTLRFGKYSSRYDDVLAGRHTNIFDTEMSSGALMDMGVYCVEVMVALFGAPESVLAMADLLDEPTRAVTHGPLDGAGTILARYPGHFVNLNYTKIGNDLSASQVEGELGTLTVDAVSTPSRARVDMRAPAVRGAAKQMGYSGVEVAGEDVALPTCENTMRYELADFIAAVGAVRAGAPVEQAAAGPYGSVGCFRELTLATLAVMDEARRQMGVRFPADRER